ncbi:MAG: hypothetical protein WBW16_08150 [Bacteroidota bacterium]
MDYERRIHFLMAQIATNLIEILLSLPMMIIDLAELLGVKDPSCKLPAFRFQPVVQYTCKSILKRRSL